MRLPSFNLMPREERFFGLLKSSAENVHEAAKKLLELMEHYDDVPTRVAEIKRLEEIGDHIIHEIMRNLHRTFVTPLDRNEIALLAQRLDDVADAIEESARTMLEYRIETPTERAKELARIIERATGVMLEAIVKLRFRGAKLREILPLTIELNRLENDADQITSRAIGELFSDAPSPIEVIKWRDIYSTLELATDLCEDVANILEGVVLEHA